ncbi:GPI inositol-deacylase [Aspergillus clavatus NRRL 1]|uniref:GPI inositol-deacylase n=1 Tax=Aspergillus clavatus (strain ATCC 1007 / CBS 513.65 / DSM 816 / NCTC 3887 / NRRL 1 / QM 1276 / 107) TaxID=344612 RepID=A1CDN7_ASPCL|nr:GPI maturation protein (Bst1), putative [Aspergillus clavatus NRRL 1]EAW11964.1 GPI maturation protein (Bst1), putative [Aspergillus clavatus NRRL 1]
MHRRLSGSPVEDDAEDSSPVSRTPTESAAHTPNNAFETSEKSRSQIAKRGTSFDLRRDNGASTPRSRNSSLWRTPSASTTTTTPTMAVTSADTKPPSSSLLMPLASQRLPMGGSPESFRLRSSRLRSPWSCSVLTAITTLVASIFLFFIVRSFSSRQIGGDGCGIPVMSPTFLRMVGFDTEHTRFASKYNLYLYREEGVDPYNQENLGLNGAPVLFLPGNAGSYRQVRSLAAEASRHYHDVVRHDQERVKAGTRSLDFFMIDFNEDMAAFHGQTLLDQAEYVNEAVAYILSLYHDPKRSRRDPQLPDPSSVILVGHSMGGIVARTALTMANYQANSVNTIVTMSAPHAKPPVSFESDIVHTYKQINDYWREAYSQTWANNNPLWHVTLISIAGGSRDTVVPSDYASISSLVPETHGFTVFTSTIPDVWIGMDHLSITWCDQFRKTIIKSLFDIVDVRRASQTKPRAERMRIFKKWYLTGLESVAERTLPQKEPNTLLTLEDKANSIMSQGQRLILRELGHRTGPKVHLLPIPPQGVSGKKFTFLTDQKLDKTGEHGNLEVLFCSVFPLQNGKFASVFTMNLDFSGGNTGSTRLACKNAAEDSIHLPASTPASKDPFDRVQPFSYLQYDLEDLAEHQFVAVVDKANTPTTGWVLAEFSDSSDAVIRARGGLGGLLSTGLKMRLPANRPMVTEVKIPALHSSLLDYKLHIVRHHHGNKQELFAPLLRQSILDPHESKFFVNVEKVNVNLHGLAPFMPPPLREQAALGGVSFQLWTDPSCGSTVDISLKVDIVGSLGELVMRYRTIFAAFPVLVVALVLRKQFQVYDETGYFITFAEGLDSALRSSLPILLLAMSLLASSFATSTRLPPSDDPFRWRANATESPIDFTRNDLLLGSQDAFFWFLVPVFGFISVGICVILNYLALVLLSVISFLYGYLKSKSGYIKRNEKGTPIFSAPTPRRRMINTAILLVLVSTIVPYQFAYMVACIVQLATCVRAQWHARETRTTAHYNFSNYAHSIFLLMLWILPINILVLLVWAHNLVVHWFMPFSSHHNVLSIMPFILLVETMTSGTMIPRVTTRLKHVTSMILFIMAIYSAVYGVSYAYLLHHLANFLAAWLVIIYFFSSGFSFRRLWRILEGDDVGHSISELGGGHQKKKP